MSEPSAPPPPPPAEIDPQSPTLATPNLERKQRIVWGCSLTTLAIGIGGILGALLSSFYGWRAFQVEFAAGQAAGLADGVYVVAWLPLLLTYFVIIGGIGLVGGLVWGALVGVLVGIWTSSATPQRGTVIGVLLAGTCLPIMLFWLTIIIRNPPLPDLLAEPDTLAQPLEALPTLDAPTAPIPFDPPADIATQRYTHPEGGFSLDVPQTWSAQAFLSSENQDGSIGVQFTSDDPLEMMWVLLVPSAEAQTAEHLADELATTLEQLHSAVTHTGTSFTPIFFDNHQPLAKGWSHAALFLSSGEAPLSDGTLDYITVRGEGYARAEATTHISIIVMVDRFETSSSLGPIYTAAQSLQVTLAGK